MIVANISSFEGQCSEAEHYYCNYEKIENYKIGMYYNVNHSGIELKRRINEKEAKYLNEKDTWNGWQSGMRTVRFNTIEQIHSALKELFPSEDIITYYEKKIFKEMLLIKDDVNLGRDYFGEIWDHIPTSCYSDLLPPKNQIKVKCEECGHEFQFEEITYEKEWNERKLTQFFKKREMNKCCNDMTLKWNVIL